MRIVVITLFPEMFEAIKDFGITGRAVDKGLVSIHCINPREFTEDRHQTVDDRPYGGGPGMVMMVKPLMASVDAAKRWLASQGSLSSKVIYLSPQGIKLDQLGVQSLYSEDDLILIAGRYEGVDERVIQSLVDEEWSIGDYVLSGGELPAMVMMDAVIRLIPGALGDQESALQDSFCDGLLDCPHYTRPPEIGGLSVPSVLMSGDHKKIALWRLQQSLGRTWDRRPDLLERLQLTDEQQALLNEYIESNGNRHS